MTKDKALELLIRYYAVKLEKASKTSLPLEKLLAHSKAETIRSIASEMLPRADFLKFLEASNLEWGRSMLKGGYSELTELRSFFEKYQDEYK